MLAYIRSHVLQTWGELGQFGASKGAQQNEGENLVDGRPLRRFM